MRRELRRREGAALAVLLAMGGLFLWRLATASPGSGLRESGGERVEEIPVKRTRIQSRALLEGAAALEARVPASLVSSLEKAGARLQPRLLSDSSPPPPPPRSAPPEPAPVTLLPPVVSELQADGLPASGLRCTREGDGLSCGSCRTDSDCPPGKGCVANRETRRFECMDSECEEDVHCFPGLVCRRVSTGATGSPIRRCVPEGQRRLGEPCDTLHLSPTGSCREGLRCVQQVCTAPCSLEDAASCPAGQACTDSPNGPGCFPDCRQLGCPEGQRCSRVRDEFHQCLAASEGDCRDAGCPEGQHCNMRQSRGRAVFWCAALCNPLLPDSCPSGQVCGMGSATISTCFRKCEPLDAEACGPGWTCATVTEDMTVFGCRPEVAR